MTSSTDEPDPRLRLRRSMQRLHTSMQRILFDGFVTGDRVVTDGVLVPDSRLYGHVHDIPFDPTDDIQWVVVTIEGSITHGSFAESFPARLQLSEIHHAD